MLVTPHFTAEEFACHDGTDYPAEWVEERLRPLCEALEAIRAEVSSQRVVDIAIAVISGYRTPAWNARVKGAKHSRHVEGDGADVRAMGLSPKELHAVALRLHRQGRIRIGGLGLYKGWVHVDVRPRPANTRLKRWQGEGVGSEVV